MSSYRLMTNLQFLMCLWSGHFEINFFWNCKSLCLFILCSDLISNIRFNVKSWSQVLNFFYLINEKTHQIYPALKICFICNISFNLATFLPSSKCTNFLNFSKNSRFSAINWQQKFVSLNYVHRMHLLCALN